MTLWIYVIKVVHILKGMAYTCQYGHLKYWSTQCGISVHCPDMSMYISLDILQGTLMMALMILEEVMEEEAVTAVVAVVAMVVAAMAVAAAAVVVVACHGEVVWEGEAAVWEQVAAWEEAAVMEVEEEVEEEAWGAVATNIWTIRVRLDTVYTWGDCHLLPQNRIFWM